jgi:hypothetical protein
MAPVSTSLHQWRIEEEEFVRFNPPITNKKKFQSFDKAVPNPHFKGKYIRNNLFRVRVSLI